MTLSSVGLEQHAGAPGLLHAHARSGPTYTHPTSVGVPLVVARRLLVLAEFATVVVSAILAKILYLDWYLETGQSSYRYVAISFALGFTLYIAYKQMNLYDLEELSGPELNVGKLFGGLIVSLLIVLGALYALKEVESVSRGWIFVWLGMAALLIMPVRAVIVRAVRRGKATGMLLQRIAVIGTKEYALSLASRMRQTQGLSNAIDLYDSSPQEEDPRFVGGLAELENTMSVRPYDRVVIAIPTLDIDNIRAVVRSLGSYSTELLICADLNGLPIVTEGARRIAGVRADVIHLLPRSENSWLIKRALDLVIAAAATLALAPLFVLIAVAIKLDSPGRVFFRQRRIGQNGIPFMIYKFRSMTVMEDGLRVVQAASGDPRVTRVGRILRATSVDELPQLINVLLGHMSLVGPRPHAVVHDDAFERQFDLFSRRRRVKPGITGWSQVNGFRGETKVPDDIRRRMELDLYYIDHWSIWLDIEILARTFVTVARGAH
jgi:Undecaprenyl-phosphate glucose phosphotransferase